MSCLPSGVGSLCPACQAGWDPYVLPAKRGGIPVSCLPSGVGTPRASSLDLETPPFKGWLSGSIMGFGCGRPPKSLCPGTAKQALPVVFLVVLLGALPVAVAVAVACLRPAPCISWFFLSQNIASRLRETLCFEKARFSCTRIAYFCWGSAEKNIGSQIFC